MMKIEMENGKANVYTPYNPDFVKAIKGIGGAKWNGSGSCWIIPGSAVEAVREIMVDVCGYSDIKENETVCIRLTFNEEARELQKDVVLFGKVLSHAYGRDSGARVGDDVAYTAGGATSGGSAKNWYSIVKEGSVVVLTNVNRYIYEKAETKYDVTVEVLETKADKLQLLAEKERLIKRIAEIEKLLRENVG